MGYAENIKIQHFADHMEGLGIFKVRPEVFTLRRAKVKVQFF